MLSLGLVALFLVSKDSFVSGNSKTLPPTYIDASLESRGMLSSKLSVNMILDNYHLYNNDTVDAENEILTYVTPWNRKGYEYAKMMASKIRWLAPVWFRISKDGDRVVLDGTQDVDTKWLAEVVDASQHCDGTDDFALCEGIEIVPRVAFESDDINSEDDYVAVYELLMQLQARYGFQGFTLELPLNNFQRAVILTRALHSPQCKVILVFPPVTVSDDLRHGLTVLFEHVDRISVMTYDHNKGTGLPNAPYNWVEEVMSSLSTIDGARRKLLLGIPLYGYRQGEAVIGDGMIQWLKENKQNVHIVWDPEMKEHTFYIQSPRVLCSYPTPLFVKERVHLATDLGVAGVALWELGQMMTMLLDTF